jgi:hypothetical protein
MSVQLTTIKRLFAKSGNQCAMPRCTAPIIVGAIPVGQICHIRARSKKGPRYDATMTADERNAYANLMLLCRTCHRLVDADEATYTPELLTEIKEIHERSADCEITPKVAREAELLFATLITSKTAYAKAQRQGVAIAVGGDNNAPITVHQSHERRVPKNKYPANSIGADANMGGYVEYLVGLGIDYWKSAPEMTPGRLGKKIKIKFRLKTRTRQYIPVSRFEELVDFIVSEILMPSPAGKRNIRIGRRVCRTFEEWKSDPM